MTSNNHNAAAANGGAFDELDPHGFDKAAGHGHGSHVIVGPFTLRTVLAFLLVFTVLTVFLAQAEVWAQGYFHIELPWWVNVVGAMSIAVVKALLVMGFFMQLKYDNPINTVLMCFTFAALATFLGFTGMDLFNRGAVDMTKQAQVTPGGTGSGVSGSNGKPMVTAAAERMVEFLAVTEVLDEHAGEPGSRASLALKSLASDIRRSHRGDALKYATDALKEIQQGADKATSDELGKVAGSLKSETPAAKERFEEMRETMHRAHGHVEAPEPVVSTASMSRPKTGLSDALSAGESPAPTGHGNTEAQRRGEGH